MGFLRCEVMAQPANAPEDIESTCLALTLLSTQQSK